VRSLGAVHAYLALLTMWKDPRKLALLAMTAGVYAAGGLVTKYFQIVPGFLDLRPAAVFPLVFGILLGAPACWGAGLGNLIQDILGGMFGPGSAVGFAANFLLAMVAWRVGAAFGLPSLLAGRQRPPGFSRTLLIRTLPAILLSSAACALALGWGLDVLGLLPFLVLGNVVFLNNAVFGIVLGPLLLAILGPRVDRWELGEDLPAARPELRTLALGLLVLGAGGGFLALNALCLGSLVATSTGVPGVASVGAAALGLLLLGLALL
jgi:energy-coupling factor transport system substrate-specific component